MPNRSLHCKWPDDCRAKGAGLCLGCSRAMMKKRTKPMPELMMDEEQNRREDIVKTVLRNKRLSVAEIAAKLKERYGECGEVIGGDPLYPTDTTWYFNAPKRG